jgi:membrane AbrB-like protein
VIVRWTAVGGATVAAGWALDRLGVPSSYLFGALLLGLAVALVKPGFVDLPAPAFTAAQALTGVVLGAYLQSSSLRAVADAWLPVALVSAGTLGVCVGCGYVMSRVTDLDQPTAQLGLIAGGASGIVAMTDELGGDDRIVAFMQYLRVLIVVLITPVLAGIFFPGHHADAGAVPDIPFLGDVKDWAIVALCAPAGALAARAIRLPAGTLLGPMAVAGALTLTGAFGDFVVPELVQQTAFIFIGLQVGLKFTTATVKEVGKLLIPVLISIVVLLAACFVLALILTATTDQSLFSSYLATTPGGLYAVLAVAFGAGANTTFILAVQSLRLLVMVLLAPLVVRRVVSPRSG